MVARVVVPEGLAHKRDGKMQECLLSDHYEAVLERVIRDVPPNGEVFLAPGNPFGCEVSEEVFAADYLKNKRPDLKAIVPSDVSHDKYLDTFDNAKILRSWLQNQGRWPFEEVVLYCNAPHRLRSAVLFRLCGFNVQLVIGCCPETVHRKMAPRLWYYNYLPIHFLYEGMALVHNFGRWVMWKIANPHGKQ